jgi:hypothetical protein
MAKVEKPRKVLSKDDLLDVLQVQLCEKLGVRFRVDDGKYSQSRADLWRLYKVLKSIEIGMASAGTLSLSGLNVASFGLVGRTHVRDRKTGKMREVNKRNLRYKNKVSSAINRYFSDHQDLISVKVEESSRDVEKDGKVTKVVTKKVVSVPLPKEQLLDHVDRVVKDLVKEKPSKEKVRPHKSTPSKDKAPPRDKGATLTETL